MTFVAIWANACLWISYGIFIKAVHPIATTNLVGLVVGSYFIYVFYSNAPRKRALVAGCGPEKGCRSWTRGPEPNISLRSVFCFESAASQAQCLRTLVAAIGGVTLVYIYAFIFPVSPPGHCVLGTAGAGLSPQGRGHRRPPQRALIVGCWRKRQSPHALTVCVCMPGPACRTATTRRASAWGRSAASSLLVRPRPSPLPLGPPLSLSGLQLWDSAWIEHPSVILPSPACILKAAVALAGMYASPFGAVLKAIQMRSNKPLSILFSGAGLSNSILWTIFGSLEDDPWVSVDPHIRLTPDLEMWHARRSLTE
jgi:hypothetical protein